MDKFNKDSRNERKKKLGLFEKRKADVKANELDERKKRGERERAHYRTLSTF